MAPSSDKFYGIAMEELKELLRSNVILQTKILEGDHDVLIRLEENQRTISASMLTLSNSVTKIMDDHEGRLRESEKKIDRIYSWGPILYIIGQIIAAMILKRILP